mgnify:CR=1 FL=1|tara:strand:- start:272 stop:1117 length:846 start_codon:yes stop_codon:yes gene_type:complete
MELPNEIWDIIVKQSKKSNYEFIKDMSIYELYELEYEIKEKRKKIYDTIKSKLNKYDIIKVTHKTDKKAYNCDLLITNLNLTNNNEIYVTNLNKCNEKCIFGNYKDGDTISFPIDLNYVDIKVTSSLADRNKENIKIANSLKIGDVFIYSNYTSAEWVKHRRRYIDLTTFKNSFCYSIVEDMTTEKLIIKNHTIIRDEMYVTRFNRNKEYINKNIVLKKLNFKDNEKLYSNLKKDYFMDKINNHFRSVNKLYHIKNHFDNIDKVYIKHLINLQKKFNIKRP